MRETKKEALAQFHRTNIIRAAEKLFLEKGIESTTMDNIAKEAEYSKATIYVYFKNKEEIISSITLISMKMYLSTINEAIAQSTDIYQQYYDTCYSLVNFNRDYLFYYECLLREINVEIDLEETPKVYREIYDAGEEINKVIGSMLERGIKLGIIRSDIHIIETVFLLWAGISSVIKMAKEKEKYLSKFFGITKESFLQYSFETLLKSILVESKE
ncbi:MAG: TetR/AcrR family transcriptional regulator [Eubacteriales bacterium]|nr:TetR/AcrR family transcriptional regulator [Eubacteriales bacterium]